MSSLPHWTDLTECRENAPLIEKLSWTPWNPPAPKPLTESEVALNRAIDANLARLGIK